MTKIAGLETRLAQYRQTETDILQKGQKFTDEDERELQRANLASVQNAIREIEQSIAALKRPRRTRQYPARV